LAQLVTGRVALMRRKLVIAGLLAGAALAAMGGLVLAQDIGAQERLAGMRRLTEGEYRNSIRDIFGPTITVQGRFEPERRIGGLLASSTTLLSITPSGLDGYVRIGDSIAAQVVDEKNRARTVPCTPRAANAADSACAGQALSQFGLALFRRPLTSAELKSRVALADKIAADTGNFHTGLRYALSSLLASPDFLFRKERAVPAADGKSWTLEPYSRATRLSYLLWHTTPDAALLQAAASGELASEAGVAKQVDRLMASPRLERGMEAFYSDYLELDRFDDISKDATIYPKYNDAVAQGAREETMRVMLEMTLRQKGDFRDLMTTRKTYINRALAPIYGVPFNFDGEWMPHEFAEKDGRSGLLTHISTLSLFSHPGRSSPTNRGVAVVDILMCQPIPQPPGDIDFSLINDATNPKLKTVRQRLSAHATQATCASCHNRSDPIGLSLEHFDSIGAWRDLDNGEKIDATATLGGQSFDGAVGLGKVLRDNPRFPQCFARKMFAYGTGGNTITVTPGTYNSFLNSFIQDGYRVPGLIRAVAISPQFFQVPAPVSVQASNSKP
jgi:hypothetical protein